MLTATMLPSYCENAGWGAGRNISLVAGGERGVCSSAAAPPGLVLLVGGVFRRISEIFHPEPDVILIRTFPDEAVILSCQTKILLILKPTTN